METPAYVGALQAFRIFGAKVTFLPCDEEGLDPDTLRVALRREPKLVYLAPTFQNSSGLSYSARRRQEVAEVMTESDVVLLEDDPYRELWYDGPPPPPIAAEVDPARRIYMGSFSLQLGPAQEDKHILGARPVCAGAGTGMHDSSATGSPHDSSSGRRSSTDD